MLKQFKKWRRNTMKKVAIMILVIILAVGMLAACTTGSPGTAQPSGGGGEGDGFVFGFNAQFLSHEFYQRCIQGMETKCAEVGAELVIADSNGDPNEQLNIAQQFITNKVDCIILSPVDPTACKAITDLATKAGVPVITESDEVEGALTLVGADTYSAGVEIGGWIGNYLVDNGISGEILVCGLPGLPNIANLERGYKDGLAKTDADYKIVAEVDGQGMKEISMQVAMDALTANPNVNVILGINDDSVLGALQAYKTLGRDVDNVITGTFGLEGNAGSKAMMEEGSLTMAMGYMPEYYGFKMIEAAVKAAKGEELPLFYPSPVRIVTPDNFFDFYTKEGDDYVLNIAAVAALDN